MLLMIKMLKGKKMRKIIKKEKMKKIKMKKKKELNLILIKKLLK